MKICCIMQARMGSSRLPGKVLEPLLGKPVLWWDMYRLAKCRYLDEVIVATTTEARDDQIVNLCEAEGWLCFRGDENDVLDRYYRCAKEREADVVVRVTSDCPLIEPAVTDRVIATYLSAYPVVDYVNNFERQTFPLGFATEVFSFAALEAAWKEDTKPEWREHVTPYLYRTPGRFRLLGVENAEDYSQIRVTLDTPQDYQLITRLYQHFGHGDFCWADWMAVIKANPEWLEINSDVKQKVLL
ncbi:MAG: glycosyltransferase family protein [Bdellovibrionales bacterium]|nr:glycosyltransferase family protein [Bdellovibrionales bacterium]